MRGIAQQLWHRVYGPVYCRHLRPWLNRHAHTKQEISFSLDAREGIADVLERLSNDFIIKQPDYQAPIFVLASGWRTGSTLLQRLLMSSGELLLWGEPYSDARPIQHMARSLTCFRPRWPNQNVLIKNKRLENLSDEWIAYLFPDVNDLYAAHRKFLMQFLKQPAVDNGFMKWGLKEVRLSIEHAYYLRWLFPEAKFIFLVRDPVDAWKSYKGNEWHLEWPTIKIHSVEQFSTMWSVLASGFANDHKKFHSQLVRYEDLIDDSAEVVSNLENFTGISIDKRVLEKRFPGFNNLPDGLFQ
jgi:hypothetical protein